MNPTLLVIGGTGFIGREVVAEALRQDWAVRALARSDEAGSALTAAGAQAVRAEVGDASEWQDQARGAKALIDLVQPKFPKRLGRSAARRISTERQAITRSVLSTLAGIPAPERPLLFFVSGADDLEPDQGTITHESPLRSEPEGFAEIGVPVRRLIEQSGIDAAYVYFGVMVYGPGKVFADVYVKGLKKRRAPIIGSGANRLPLTYVTDAARALVHLAGLPRAELAGRSFVACDGADTTQRELLEKTAQLMGAKPPRSVPAWLAGAAAGAVAVETMTLDVHADPSALLESGFSFRFPSHREGVPDLLARLAERPQ
jgi:nucleoside-diphosphate-sugar epimerase